MYKINKSKCLMYSLVCSIGINLLFAVSYYYVDTKREHELSWSRNAAIEAETVGSMSCSGHGRAFLDGLVGDGDRGFPVCECNSCYGGPDCSILLPGCSANADGGDPLFLEPFWRKKAESSALVIAGWHRMGYSFNDGTFISQELESHIRRLHMMVGNAETEGRYIVFGVGSTQLLNAAVHALSPHDDSSSTPADVFASIPFYPVYQVQTDWYESVDFKFKGDASMWKNTSGGIASPSTTMIEFVTSPNNPDGLLKKPVLDGENVKVIYDHAYYWPHFTAIPSPANGDLMIFTLSKLTGHAGSRFGWAVIKDANVYQQMVHYMRLNTMGDSRETQLRALKLLKAILNEGQGRAIFEFGHDTMKKRWDSLNKNIAMSTRFSLPRIPPLYCTFFKRVRPPSPAYAWLKCEREEDSNCNAVFQAANITARSGSTYLAEDRYVRLSLIRSQDDFDLLVHRLEKLVSDEDGPKTM